MLNQDEVEEIIELLPDIQKIAIDISKTIKNWDPQSTITHEKAFLMAVELYNTSKVEWAIGDITNILEEKIFEVLQEVNTKLGR